MITSTDLIAAYSAETLKQWADDDRDGVADDAVLNAAITKAENEVLTALYPAFASVMPFDSGSEPQVVKDIAVAFAGYALAGRRQVRTESIKESFAEAKESLKKLLEKGAMLVFPDGTTAISQGMPPKSSSYAFYSSTEDTEKTFTDSRMSDFVGDEP